MDNKIRNLLNSCLMLINENKFFIAKVLINNEISQSGYRKDLLELLLHIEVSEENWNNAEQTATLLIDLNSQVPKYYNNYGYILYKLGKLEESIFNYKKAIELNDKYTEAYNNLGVSLVDLNRKEEAIFIYQKALYLDFNNIDILINLSALMSESKKYNDAKIYYEKAIGIDRNNPLLLNNYANFLKDIGDYKNAAKFYDEAISLDPMYFDALFNRAALHRHTMNLNKALADIELLLEHEYSATNFCIKAYISRDLCLAEESTNSFLSALNIDINCLEARWSLPFAKLIPIYTSQNIVQLINEIENNLHDLRIWISINKNLHNIESGVGSTLPFYLAYINGQNKKIFELYGNICIDVMKEWQLNKKTNISKILETDKIRIGIIGAHFKSHSVWHALTKGIVIKLNKSIFSIFIFDLGKNADSETNIAKENATKYYNDQGDLNEWYDCIVQSSCDILIYPEIGMHQLTYQLACLRISDSQICFWGHPESTGLKTIDYYISADLFETDDSTTNYIEQLIKLPNLGTYLFKDINLSVNEISFNIEYSDIPVIVCGGMLYKYKQMYDWIFTELVKKIGKVKILFFSQNNEWKEIFFARLKIQFDKEELNINNYIYILEFHEKNAFYSLMKKSTLLLDTIGFSGFNTALMAIESNLPVVSLKNNSMKANLANAILTRIGLKELIAKDFDEFFDVILKLINDKKYHINIKKIINENKNKLYEDSYVISELEDFFIREYKKKNS
jgi:protein O-GlcNAc transferase